MARRSRAASSLEGHGSRGHRVRLLRQLDLSGRRLPARLQPVLGLVDHLSPRGLARSRARPAPAPREHADPPGEGRRLLLRVARASHERPVLAGPRHQSALCAHPRAGLQRRGLVRRLPGRHPGELRAHAPRRGQRSGPQRAEAPHRPLGPWEHVWPVSRPQLSAVRAGRRGGPGGRAATLLRQVPEGRAQRHRRRAAGAHLRHGREPLARRAGLASSEGAPDPVLPSRSSRGRRRPGPVPGASGRRAAGSVCLRPQRPGAHRRRIHLAAGAALRHRTRVRRTRGASKPVPTCSCTPQSLCPSRSR